jgi:hypothetical protein
MLYEEQATLLITRVAKRQDFDQILQPWHPGTENKSVRRKRKRKKKLMRQ